MNKTIRGMCFMCALCFLMTGCGGGGEESTSSSEEEQPKLDTVLNERLKPIWEDGGTAINETAFVIQDQEGNIQPIQMAYPIDEIVSVKNFALDMEYTDVIDYTVKDGKLIVKDTGHIDSIPYDQFYFKTYKEGENWPEVNGTGAQLLTEAQCLNGISYKGLTQWQIAVTYKHAASWEGAVPLDKSSKFTKVNEKLEKGEALNVVCLGDSISAGWTASGYAPVFLEPYCPPYFDLVCNYMNAKYGNINATNISVGGMVSSWGAEAKQIQDVIANNADLLILAFGMNDGSGQSSVPPSVFKQNIKKTIDSVREKLPDCEVVLVSTMLPNAEVGYAPGNSILGNQANYLSVLCELENEYTGVGVADVTTIHKYLLERKQFKDMSSNNINHPNDYVHRVYAQIVLKTLFGKIDSVLALED